jgi:hypothetical protein
MPPSLSCPLQKAPTGWIRALDATGTLADTTMKDNLGRLWSKWPFFVPDQLLEESFVAESAFAPLSSAACRSRAGTVHDQ